MQIKTTRGSQVKNAVDAGKINPEGNDVSKEDLDVDQKCRDNFYTWYWNRLKLKEGKKLVSKCVCTCDSSLDELCTNGSFGNCRNIYYKIFGNSSESVIILGDVAMKVLSIIMMIHLRRILMVMKV